MKRLYLTLTAEHNLRIVGDVILNSADKCNINDFTNFMRFYASNQSKHQNYVYLSSNEFTTAYNSWYTVIGKSLRAQISDWLTSSNQDNLWVDHVSMHVDQSNATEVLIACFSGDKYPFLYYFSLVVQTLIEDESALIDCSSDDTASVSLVNDDVKRSVNLVLKHVNASEPEKTGNYTKDDLTPCYRQNLNHPFVRRLFEGKSVTRSSMTEKLMEQVSKKLSSEFFVEFVRLCVMLCARHLRDDVIYYIDTAVREAKSKTASLSLKNKNRDQKEIKGLEKCDIDAKFSMYMLGASKAFRNVLLELSRTKECELCHLSYLFMSEGGLFSFLPFNVTSSSGAVSMITDILPKLHYWYNMLKETHDVLVSDSVGQVGPGKPHNPELVLLGVIAQNIFYEVMRDENTSVQDMKIHSDNGGQYYIERKLLR